MKRYNLQLTGQAMATSKGRSSAQQVAHARDDVFVSGLERVENAGGGCLRFVLYVMKEIDGEMTKVELDECVVMPKDALPDAIGKALMALGRQVLVRPDGSLTVTH